MNKEFGLSELIQTGILFTLLGIAYGLGVMIQKFDSKLDDHERRIIKIEDRVF